ncbi:matrixin family metalloprotease [Modestobacter sp. Leaf380]|uniref:matrixin family metalloprotease n=1 Tax=Modestobacter sp. Leaf380 TaxID=1736356 RepID=UPI0006FC3F2D|nr:matrixin family metalloprotease [Modestobacter sp. Leaf380]KQS69258.1 hypothetical protein ASG41_21840 [Modestobacter sp. Leaf380]
MSEPDETAPIHRVSPSGRVPQWVLDEAAGREPVGVTGRDWFVEEPPPPPRKRRRGRVVLGLVTLAAVVAGVVYLPELADRSPEIPQAAAEVPAVVAAPSGFPTPGVGASGQPLGTPPPAPEDPGAFGFIELQADGTSPVAYDPCRPVDVVLSLDGAPEGAEAMVTDALARLSEVTGLQFDYEGTTAEVPVEGRGVFQPDVYGDRWAPVLIGWRTPDQQPALAGQVAGLGGSAWASPSVDGTKVYVSGNVTLDGPEFADLVTSERGSEVARSILLHELGHVVGLQHVWDTDQLMYATTDGSVLDFADGDLAGLARLGAGECVPDL